MFFYIFLIANKSYENPKTNNLLAHPLLLSDTSTLSVAFSHQPICSYKGVHLFKRVTNI